jgi:uncharacterized membrane protein YdcZ (DUF606 family)
LPHGSNTVVAEYAGNGSFVGSTNNVIQVVNTPPVGGTHNLGATMNTAVNVSATTLAGLSYDADGDTLTITDVGTASHGTVGLSGGTLTYTPTTDYVGTDSFTYTVSDGFSGGTSTGTANVNVRLGKATSVFNSITSPASGTMALQGYGIPGHQYDVQVSGDLSNWTTLDTVTAAPNSIILYTDTNANTSPRYYRFAVH